jgi:hypothetical protein
MKSTKAEILKRVEKVYERRLLGDTYLEICHFASLPEQGWKVGGRQLQRYIRLADKMLEKRTNLKATYLFAKQASRRDLLFNKAWGQDRDVLSALKVLDGELKLLAVFLDRAKDQDDGDDQPEPGQDNGKPDFDLAAAFANLAARLSQGNPSEAGPGEDPAGGPLLGGPSEGDERRGDGAGPLAGRPAEAPFAEDVTPLFPPGL